MTDAETGLRDRLQTLVIEVSLVATDLRLLAARERNIVEVLRWVGRMADRLEVAADRATEKRRRP